MKKHFIHVHNQTHTGLPEVTWTLIGSNSNITEIGIVEDPLYKMLGTKSGSQLTVSHVGMFMYV